MIKEEKKYLPGKLTFAIKKRLVLRDLKRKYIKTGMTEFSIHAGRFPFRIGEILEVFNREGILEYSEAGNYYDISLNLADLRPLVEIDISTSKDVNGHGSDFTSSEAIGRVCPKKQVVTKPDSEEEGHGAKEDGGLEGVTDSPWDDYDENYDEVTLSY